MNWIQRNVLKEDLVPLDSNEKLECMENPLVTQIEDLSSKTIGDVKYHNKSVVLLEDAIEALEELESKLWAVCKQEIDRARAVSEVNI